MFHGLLNLLYSPHCLFLGLSLDGLLYDPVERPVFGAAFLTLLKPLATLQEHKVLEQHLVCSGMRKPGQELVYVIPGLLIEPLLHSSTF